MSDSYSIERPLLIVDDEPAAITGLQLILESEGFENLLTCNDARQVMAILRDHPVSVMLLDLSMPHIDGQTILKQTVQQHPETAVIVVTGYNNVETAIECMKIGAFDYMVKPAEDTRLVSSVRRAVEFVELKSEYTSFRQRVLDNTLEHPEHFAHIVTSSRKLFNLFQYVETIAPTRWPVLITGDTGTGKELMAKALHLASGRTGSFVPINAAGLDAQMFSDTLFGHVRGAFTGAESQRIGLVEQAQGGTLFLDEIGDLSLDSQVKLLRLLQENEYLPVGADAPKIADTRIIVATNKSLQQEQADGTFRSDLYFRLNTHHVHIPALKDRKEDIAVLVSHFVNTAADALNKAIPTLPPELTQTLAGYPFPGNIRELEAMVFDAMSKNQNPSLPMDTFLEYMDQNASSVSSVAPTVLSGSTPFQHMDPLPSLARCREMLIDEAMARSNQNQTAAAQMIGITRSGLSKALSRNQKK